MLFSCKISHSVLTYLDRQGADLVSFFETSEFPKEFLRNPMQWLEAEKMEDLLGLLTREYTRLSREGHLIQEAGHHCKDLRAWGVLDSVLRMVQSPKDIYSQPDRFISYFVSPAPPIGNLQREADSVAFEIPIAASQYPHVTEYLRVALEALPTYVGKPMATVTWDESRIEVNWTEKQESLFGEGQAGPRHLSPEIVQGILHNLEVTQKQLEETKQTLAETERTLAERERELIAAQGARRLKAEAEDNEGGSVQAGETGFSGMPIMRLAQGLKVEIAQPAQEVLNSVYRLNDYLARAQQLVTLLVGQDRQTRQVQEAMRRVDWSFIQSESPAVVQKAAGSIRKVQDVIKDLALLASGPTGSGKDQPEAKVSTNLNLLVAKAIKVVQEEFPLHAPIEQHLLLDRDIPVYQTPIERALVNLLKNAVQAVDGKGFIRVVTRPNGARAEIEIIDSGVGMDETTLARSYEPFFTTQQPGTAAGLGLSLAQSIVRGHDGSLTINSRPGHGTTIVVSLPIAT